MQRIDHTQCAAGYAAHHAGCEEADSVSGDWEEGARCVSELQHMTLKGSSDLMLLQEERSWWGRGTCTESYSGSCE